MIRRLFTLLSTLSLLLCMMLVILWVRSYKVRDRLTWTAFEAQGQSYRRITFESIRGGLTLEDYRILRRQRLSDEGFATWARQDRAPAFVWECLPPATRPHWTTAYSEDMFLYPDDWPDFGPDPWAPKAELFRRILDEPSISNPCRGVVLPYWLVALIAFVPILGHIGVVVLAAVRRDGAPGLCPICGYDLRASKERCPECGTAMPLIRKPSDSGFDRSGCRLGGLRHPSREHGDSSPYCSESDVLESSS